MLEAASGLSLTLGALALILLVTVVACGGPESSPEGDGSPSTPGENQSASDPTATPESRRTSPSLVRSTATPGPTEGRRADETTATPESRRTSPSLVRSTATPGPTEGRRADEATATPESRQTSPSPDMPTPAPARPPTPAKPTARPPLAQTSPETDRGALAALFKATNGESWDRSKTWLGHQPMGEWPGVTTERQRPRY